MLGAVICVHVQTVSDVLSVFWKPTDFTASTTIENLVPQTHFLRNLSGTILVINSMRVHEVVTTTIVLNGF